MISKYFTRSEMACQCGECQFAVVDAELLMVLEDLRGHYCLPVRITSGCRCRSHNDYVGGSAMSKHCLGIAADVVVVGAWGMVEHFHISTCVSVLRDGVTNENKIIFNGTAGCAAWLE